VKFYVDFVIWSFIW